MATLTITHTVRSATITDPRNFTATTTKQVSGGTVVDRLVGAAWVQVYDNNTAGDPNHLFLMNTGAEDAIIRLSYGAGNYARLTLPAGAAMQFTFSVMYGNYLQGDPSSVEVYSANGTTIKAGLFL